MTTSSQKARPHRGQKVLSFCRVHKKGAQPPFGTELHTRGSVPLSPAVHVARVAWIRRDLLDESGTYPAGNIDDILDRRHHCHFPA